MAAVRSSSPGADSSHSSTAAVSERLRTEDGSESEKHSRMTALLERLHGKHNSSRSWQETSKVVRQAMEKRGVINTAGHQLLLNCLETLQRALKVSSLPSMTDRLESIARQNMLGSHLSPSRTECYITSDMFYVEVHLDKAGKLVDVKVAHHGENPVSCPELIQHLSDKDISSRREYRDPLHEADRHSECIACLGSAHTEAAFTGTECFHCESMSLTLLRLWIAFFHRGGPPQPALLFPHSQEPRRKKQQSSRVPSGSSDLTPTQSTSLFPQRLAFAFLDFPVSPKGLFAPAMDGFAERFMAAQKSSQAMRHFLPKCSSLVAASSRQKATSTHQPAKAAPSTTQPPPRSEPGLVQTFQVAKLNPFPKRQGPRPHVTLGPEPQKPS